MFDCVPKMPFIACKEKEKTNTKLSYMILHDFI